MNRSKIKGWKDVFIFTFTQTLKSKAYIITFVFLLTVAVLSMPIIHLITSSGNDKGEIGKLKKVYVLNQTAITSLDFSVLKSYEELKDLVVSVTNEGYDVLEKRLEDDESTSVILKITDEEGVYSFHFIRSSKKDIKNSNTNYIAPYLIEVFETGRYKAQGITDDQKAVIDIQVRTEVFHTDISGEKIIDEDTSISQGEYMFVYGLLIIIFFVNTMASSQISTSVVSDKSSKIIEYLLTSIKPLALIIGKVLAMLCSVLAQIIGLIVMVFVSDKLTSIIFKTNDSILGGFIPSSIFENINIINIICCLLMVGLGLVCYAIIAGMTGACVSRIEEINEGMTLFTLINLVGFYIGIIAASSMLTAGDSPLVTFALLFPLSSPFFLPGAVLIGKANILLICASILILAAFVIIIFRFTAKVFEVLILHNGNKIGVKELFSISKSA